MTGELFRPIFVGGAVAAVREVTEGLQVDPDRMQENLDITRGLLLSENVTTTAAQKLGRLKAHDLVKAATHRALNEENPCARCFWKPPGCAMFSRRARSTPPSTRHATSGQPGSSWTGL